MIQQSDDTRVMPGCDEPAKGGLLRWVLAGAIALLPVQLETAFELRFAPSDLFLILTLLLGVFVWRGVRPAWSIWHVGLLGLFAAGVFAKGLFGTVTQFDLVNKFGGLILLFAFYMSLTTLADGWGDLRRFMRIFVISVTAQNAASCAAFLWCKYTDSEDPLLLTLLSGSVDRLAGMLVDPNAYGGLLTVACAMALLGGDGGKPLLPRGLQIVSLLSLSIGLLLTSSRSAWIGCAFLILFAVVQKPRLLIAVPVLIAAGLAAVAYSMGSEGFDEMLTVSSRQNTIDERLEINRHAWQMFVDHPWLGGGLGSFVEEHDIIVHNSAMWFLAEFGGVGFVIFAGFVGWFCVKGVAAYRCAYVGNRPVIGALIAGHLAMVGFSLGVEALYQRYWWLVMGLLASAYVLALRDATAAAAVATAETSELATETASEPRLAQNPIT